jgi:antitoxin ParD1/3/4
MPMVKKSITVTGAQNEWLQSQIQKGLYASDSEVLRFLIREKQEKDADHMAILALRAALIEGEESGVSSRTPEQIKRSVIERKNKHG